MLGYTMDPKTFECKTECVVLGEGVMVGSVKCTKHCEHFIKDYPIEFKLECRKEDQFRAKRG